MTEKRRVGIIGGGLAGLVCAHELRKRGIEALIFEKENRPGGRIRNLTVGDQDIPVGAITFTPDYSEFISLLHELHLVDYIERIPLSESALLLGKKIVPLNRWSLATSPSLSIRTKIEIKRLWDKLDRLQAWTFDDELMKISLADYLEQVVGPDTESLIVETAINAYFQQPHEIAAAVGLQLLKSLPKVHVLKGGNATVTQTLAQELGSTIRLNSPIDSVQKMNEKWHILSGPTQAEFEAVVCTIPLDQAAQLIPASGIAPVEYAPVHVLVVQGNFHYSKVRILLDSDWRSTGIHSIKNFGRFQVVHARSPNPDLDKFFDNCNIVESVYWERALPRMRPGSTIPRGESSLEGLYLAGDFQLGGRMEVAVRSGRLAARRVTQAIES